MKKSIRPRMPFVFLLLFYYSTTLSTEPIDGSDPSSPKPTAGGNLLANGDFGKGAIHWMLWANGGRATLTVEKGEAKIAVTDPGPQPWSIGLSQKGFPIEMGESYTLSLDARASTKREIRATVQRATDPWTDYAGGVSFPLNVKKTKCSHIFNMYQPADQAADFEIFLGGQGAGTIYLDNLVLTKAGAGVPERNFPMSKPSVDRSSLIIYEISPNSYSGGARYGGKCFKGITGRLDRIKELGVNCLWLTPLFLGEGLGYWVFDHYKINARLGPLNDLKELISEAHRRDIMVILDLVLNHTWTQHPFFQDVLRNKGNSRYKDYYIWKGEPGASDFSYYFDWNTIPNLNLANPEVREYLYTAAVHWLKKLDIDGYRVDCAWALEERCPGFGAELRKRLAAVKPDVFLLAEGNVNEGRFFNNGYDGAYDWDVRGFGWTDSNAFPALFEGSLTPRKLHAILTRELPAGGLPLRFVENHDHPRAASLWGIGGSRVAHTIVLTAKGIPLIFGGAEAGFAPPLDHDYSQDDPVIWDDRSPLFEHFKKVIALRRKYLKNDLTQHWIANDSSFVYASLSKSGTNRIIVVANCSRRSAIVTLTLAAPELGEIRGVTDWLDRSAVPYDGGGSLKITLGGWETKIFLVN